MYYEKLIELVKSKNGEYEFLGDKFYFILGNREIIVHRDETEKIKNLIKEIECR